MTPEQHERVSDVFFAVCDLPADDRAAALEEHCSGATWLRVEVESLLRHHDTPALGLDVSAIPRPDLLGLSRDEDRVEHLPRNIGRYRVISVIGQGGMGTVYLAEQDRPRRIVALKVIRSDLTSQSMLRRFEFEQEVLGRLQHPGIAQIFEAGIHQPDGSGASVRGQPYFAMEYVRGLALTEYVRSHNLDMRDRLALLMKICDAVEHAHQKGVIHRDLKPANILVADETMQSPGMAVLGPSGTGAQPKILDFGVARATESDLQVTTLQTNVGQLIGTLAYMSPEQVNADVQRLDTRSDVYALGVICYELLAERLPHNIKDRSLPDAASIIRDEDPTPLSSVNRVFRGDLETIVAKALEKDPARRYQRAAEIAADINRYLHDEPIVARPASAIYQFRKFARRNKAMVAGVAAVVAVLIAATVLSSMLLVRAVFAEQQASLRLVESNEAKATAELALGREAAERAEAERQARIAKAVNDFLVDDLLAQADPEKQPDRDLSLREVLDRAALRIAGRFDDEPLVEAEIRATIGRTYRGLGEYEAAEVHLLRLLELRQEHLGDDDEQTLSAQIEIAYLLGLQGKYEDAAQLYRETLDHQRRVLGDEHSHTLNTMNNLAATYINHGRFAEAEPLLRETLEARRRTLGPEHPRTATTLNNLGAVYRNLGRYDEAEVIYLEVLDIRVRTRGDEHFETIQTLNNLAVLYGQTGRIEQSGALFERIVTAKTHTYGKDHPETLFSMNNLGVHYASVDRLEEAEQLHQYVLTQGRVALGETHPTTLMAMQRLARVLRQTQRCEEAEQMLAEVAVLYEEALMSRHVYVGLALVDRGQCLIALNRLDEAEQCLRQSFDILSAALGESHNHTQQVVRLIVELYDAQDMTDLAELWQARVRE